LSNETVLWEIGHQVSVATVVDPDRVAGFGSDWCVSAGWFQFYHMFTGRQFESQHLDAIWE
jgi:hypothetical protein